MQEVLSKINVAAMKGRSWIEANLNKSHFRSDYCGACAWASTYILHRLHQEGIDAYVAISRIPGGQHAFVVTKDYYVDVTATQFQDNKTFIPEVIVVSRKKPPEYYWQDVMARLRTPAGVVRFTKKPRWPDEQIPNLKFIEETYENF